MSFPNGGMNSPPLETTTTHHPIGKADKTGYVAEGVLDADQRATYLKKGEGQEYKTGSPAGDGIASATKAAQQSVAYTEQKWDAEHSKAQQI